MSVNRDNDAFYSSDVGTTLDRSVASTRGGGGGLSGNPVVQEAVHGAAQQQQNSNNNSNKDADNDVASAMAYIWCMKARQRQNRMERRSSSVRHFTTTTTESMRFYPRSRSDESMPLYRAASEQTPMLMVCVLYVLFY
jgi:hypothetical protein